MPVFLASEIGLPRFGWASNCPRVQISFADLLVFDLAALKEKAIPLRNFLRLGHKEVILTPFSPIHKVAFKQKTLFVSTKRGMTPLREEDFLFVCEQLNPICVVPPFLNFETAFDKEKAEKSEKSEQKRKNKGCLRNELILKTYLNFLSLLNNFEDIMAIRVPVVKEGEFFKTLEYVKDLEKLNSNGTFKCHFKNIFLDFSGMKRRFESVEPDLPLLIAGIANCSGFKMVISGGFSPFVIKDLEEGIYKERISHFITGFPSDLSFEKKVLHFGSNKDPSKEKESKTCKIIGLGEGLGEITNLNAPLDSLCGCFVCRNHSAEYIKHLFDTDEMNGFAFLEMHNEHVFDRSLRLNG